MTSNVHPEPEMVVHPRVASAFHALSHCDDMECENEEKMMFLLGHVDGMEAHVTDFAIPPQQGTRSHVKVDKDHDLWNNFWPSLNDYCEREDLTLVGWAHYFSGGQHHSSEDEQTDDMMSYATKNETPIFLSATFNEDEVGSEALCHTNIGDGEMQVTVSDINVRWSFNEQVVNNIADELRDEGECGTHMVIGDTRFNFSPEQLGFAPEALLEVMIDSFRDNPSKFIRNDDDVYELAMEQAVLDDAVETAHEMIEECWSSESSSSSSKVQQARHAAGWYGGVRRTRNQRLEEWSDDENENNGDEDSVDRDRFVKVEYDDDSRPAAWMPEREARKEVENRDDAYIVDAEPEDTDTQELLEARQQVLELVHKRGPWTTSELQRKCTSDPGTVSQAIHELADEGEIDEINGQWVDAAVTSISYHFAR